MASLRSSVRARSSPGDDDLEIFAANHHRRIARCVETFDKFDDIAGKSLAAFLCNWSGCPIVAGKWCNPYGVNYSPFSDFALHTMGDGLADGIIQGNAAANEFRTAPLWGIGQRLFFLHDGRTNDLLRAIQAHASDGSEANAVIDNFNELAAPSQQDILNFLRSL